MSEFSTRLKKERKNAGFTQKDMAGKLDIPLRTYINYEQTGSNNRQPDFDILVKISSLLDVSTDYLLGIGD